MRTLKLHIVIVSINLHKQLAKRCLLCYIKMRQQTCQVVYQAVHSASEALRNSIHTLPQFVSSFRSNCLALIQPAPFHAFDTPFSKRRCSRPQLVTFSWHQASILFQLHHCQTGRLQWWTNTTWKTKLGRGATTCGSPWLSYEYLSSSIQLSLNKKSRLEWGAQACKTRSG